MNKKKIQWHSAFCSAIRLELAENKSELIFQYEVGLNTKPILIDLLIITKTQDVKIKNDIGAFFKGHNIFEYKSPDDALNIDTFYKVIAYACLYKSSGRDVNIIKSEDITITFVRERKPKKLFRMLQKEDIIINKVSDGIYYIKNLLFFNIQFVISKELDKTEHIWLTSLTDTLTVQEAENLVIEATKFTSKDDRDFVDSVMEIAVSKNRKAFKQTGEESGMCEALMELIKPEFDAAVSKAVSETVSAAVSEAVSAAVSSAINEERTKFNRIVESLNEEIERLKKQLENK